MKVIIDERYTSQNARQRKESREYAQIIVRVARSIELSMYNQLHIIWNELNVEFQRDISMSRSNITLNAFLRELDDRKKIWWKLSKSRHSDDSLSKHESRQKSNRKNKNKNRDQTQNQRDMLKVSSNFRSRYQQDDEYNQSFLRSDLQQIFVSTQFSNLVS